MHRVRKNSLSPCCSTNNKENANFDNIVTPTGISFRNLEQARKKKTIDFERERKSAVANRTPPGHQDNFVKPSYTPVQATDRTSMQRRAKREADRSAEDMRSSLKSKDKQMGSLQSQVNTLNCTISLLKDQLTNVRNQNKALCEENTELKRTNRDKNQIIEKLKKETGLSHCSYNTRESLSPSTHLTVPSPRVTLPAPPSSQPLYTDYDEVNEKLNELEEIQDRLVQQNQQLKKKQALNQAMFRNIKILLNSGQTAQLRDLLNVLDDQQEGQQAQNLQDPLKHAEKSLNKIRQSLKKDDHNNSSKLSDQQDDDDCLLLQSQNNTKLKKNRVRGYYGTIKI